MNSKKENLNGTVLNIGLSIIMLLLVVFAYFYFGLGVRTYITPPKVYKSTKTKLTELKAALIKYNHDLGCYPHSGRQITFGKSSGPFHTNDGTNGFSAVDNECCLLTAHVKNKFWNYHKMNPKMYQQRWKGPYINGNSSDFLADTWGTGIKYGFYKKDIILHSAGPNKIFTPANEIIDNPDYGKKSSEDDILVKVAKLKTSYGPFALEVLPKGFK